MRRLLFSFSLFLATSAAADRRDARLAPVLGGIEHAPTEADVRRLGAGATSELLRAADDPTLSRLWRMRALYALRFVPSAAAHSFLLEVVAVRSSATEGADVLDYAAALGALTPYGSEELPTFLGALAHPSADVRHAAAAAIGLMKVPAVDGALKLRLAVEQDVGVRRALVRALQR
jgi:HEAT repeat protein